MPDREKPNPVNPKRISLIGPGPKGGILADARSNLVGEDGGDLVISVYAGVVHERLVIDFNKPVEWLDLGVESTLAMLVAIDDAMAELDSRSSKG